MIIAAHLLTLIPIVHVFPTAALIGPTDAASEIHYTDIPPVRPAYFRRNNKIARIFSHFFSSFFLGFTQKNRKRNYFRRKAVNFSTVCLLVLVSLIFTLARLNLFDYYFSLSVYRINDVLYNICERIITRE